MQTDLKNKESKNRYEYPYDSGAHDLKKYIW